MNDEHFLIFLQVLVFISHTVKHYAEMLSQLLNDLTKRKDINLSMVKDVLVNAVLDPLLVSN